MTDGPGGGDGDVTDPDEQNQTSPDAPTSAGGFYPTQGDPADAPAGPLEPALVRDPDSPPPRPTDDGLGFIADPRPPGDALIDQTGALGAPVSVRAADGTEWPAQFLRTETGAEVRYPVSVIETKVPYDQRPTRGLLDTPAEEAARGYRAVWQLDPDDPALQLGAPDAPDDDPVHGVGVDSWWSAWFTEAEHARLVAAPSVRSATWETKHVPVGWGPLADSGGAE